MHYLNAAARGWHAPCQFGNPNIWRCAPSHNTQYPCGCMLHAPKTLLPYVKSVLAFFVRPAFTGLGFRIPVHLTRCSSPALWRQSSAPFSRIPHVGYPAVLARVYVNRCVVDNIPRSSGTTERTVKVGMPLLDSIHDPRPCCL